jgi:3-oxoacyl-[acyl-carrier-protein] synthase-3
MAVPSAVLSSAELERQLGLAGGWIERRTGIRERRIAPPGQAVSDLAIAAAESAIQDDGLDRRGITLLVLATSTPDHPLPPTAPFVADRLGLRVPAFDLAAACTGFLYGLGVAARWLAARSWSGDGDAALVIGASVLSPRVNWADRTTAPIFGDGSGAVLLRADTPTTSGILAISLGSDGSHWRDIHIPAGGSRQPVTQEAIEAGELFMRMEHGDRLFRRAVQALEESARRALDMAELETGDVEWYVPHQGGARIVARSAELLGIPPDRVISNLACYGNTSAASIPIALHEAAQDGRIRDGDVLLLAAAGGGLTSGAAVVRWHREQSEGERSAV